MRSALAAVFAAGLAAAVPAAQSNMAAPEKFTAFAVDMSNAAPRANASAVDLTINRWSTDAERDRLLSIFRDKGQDALLDALQKLPVVGYINTPGSLKYDLHFARQRPEAEGGRMVFGKRLHAAGLFQIGQRNVGIGVAHDADLPGLSWGIAAPVRAAM